MIVKDPSLFGASFQVGWPVFRFLALSHTFYPVLKGMNPLVTLSAIVWHASLCAARASSLAYCRIWICSCAVGMLLMGKGVGIALGLYPIMG